MLIKNKMLKLMLKSFNLKMIKARKEGSLRQPPHRKSRIGESWDKPKSAKKFTRRRAMVKMKQIEAKI